MLAIFLILAVVWAILISVLGDLLGWSEFYEWTLCIIGGLALAWVFL